MNKSHVFLIFGVACMVTGFIIAWPLVRAAITYKTVSAQIIAVMVIPVDEQHSRVAFAYDYRFGGRGSDIVLGYAVANDRLEIEDDPIVTHDVARRAQTQLDGRSVRVYVDMNRPYASAFMLNPLSVAGVERLVRPEQGALLVMLGIACSILAQLTRLRR